MIDVFALMIGTHVQRNLNVAQLHIVRLLNFHSLASSHVSSVITQSPSDQLQNGFICQLGDVSIAFIQAAYQSNFTLAPTETHLFSIAVFMSDLDCCSLDISLAIVIINYS